MKDRSAATHLLPKVPVHSLPPDQVIGELILQCRIRKQVLRARTRLSNQVDAQERLVTGKLKAGKTSKNKFVVSAVARAAAEHATPVLTQHLKSLQDCQKPYDKAIESLAKQLPAYAWVKTIRGVGASILGQIIGETGDLSGYANPAKVWKRMGLAVMSDGTRQRRVTGEAAIEHGYDAEKRALMFVLGDCLIKGNKDGPYRSLYLERKQWETERNEVGANAARAEILLRQQPKASAASRSAWKAGRLTAGHIHARASRYMQKRFLVHLWEHWRHAPADTRIATVPVTH